MHNVIKNTAVEVFKIKTQQIKASAELTISLIKSKIKKLDLHQRGQGRERKKNKRE